MVDIHCHILPEVDDGAETWDTALKMCEMAAKDGIEHIVATPHANDEYSYDRERNNAQLDRLREMVAGSVQLSLGCDFHLSYENISDALVNPDRYCIGSTRFLLVEFSDYAVPPNIAEILGSFLAIGITPIIIHPERNPILQRTPEVVVEWTLLGALVQVTANSMTGRWGKSARKAAEYLAKNDAVHVLATDAHGLTSRPPILSEAREVMTKLVGREAAEAMVSDIPRSIVNGAVVF